MNIDIAELQKTLGEKELQILALKSALVELQKEIDKLREELDNGR